MANLKSLAAMVRNLGSERAQAVAEIERLRQQRDQLDVSRLPKSDLLQQLDLYINKQLEAFDANLIEALNRVRTRPNLRIDQHAHGFPLLQKMNGNGTIDGDLVLALLASAAKARCKVVIDKLAWPDAGPPASERAQLREKLDQQIEAAESALAEIDNGLFEMGMKLEHA